MKINVSATDLFQIIAFAIIFFELFGRGTDSGEWGAHREQVY